MDFTVISITKSKNKLKKYDAIIEYRNGIRKKVSFGAIKKDGTPYEQYRDMTPLRLYSDYDHNDRERKQRYLARHKNNTGPAAKLADEFLWN